MRSLEAWRQAQGLDKMVLMGHSMGGYLSGGWAGSWVAWHWRGERGLRRAGKELP